MQLLRSSRLSKWWESSGWGNGLPVESFVELKLFFAVDVVAATGGAISPPVLSNIRRELNNSKLVTSISLTIEGQPNHRNYWVR